MKLSEIARFLDGELHGPADLEISGPGKIDSARKGQITFLANSKYQAHIEKTKASAVIIKEDLSSVNLPHIKVKDAYIGFVKILNLFFPQKMDYIQGLSSQAYIDESAQVDPQARIAPFVYVGPDVKVGKGTVLFPGVSLLKDVSVGKDCVLYPSVTIRENCEIGNRVILHNGCVIGSDGFGFAPQNGIYEKIPQMGKVILEDDVEIGANTTIDRATLGETIIRQGTKIDNLVQIAHNVIIGKNTVVAAQSGIAGSTEIGNNVTIAAQVGIVGHIKIGDQTIIAARAGVSKTTPDKAIMWGAPALPIERQKRIEVSLRKLPELGKRVKELEKQIIDLKKIIDGC